MAQRVGLTLEQLTAGALVSESAGRSRHDSVQNSKELDRILALPLRRLGSGEELAALLTDALRTPWGEQTLRPIQALALAEIAEVRGGFFPILPGEGKTLVAFLASALLEARRPLLVVPASLLKETLDKNRELSKHWLGPHPDSIRMVSYEWLSVAKQGVILSESGEVSQEGFLERYRPDCIICDEVHKLKASKAVATKRIGRYLKASHAPFIGMSGTVTKKSVKEWAHLATWALGVGAPIPHRWTDLEQWAGALDDKVMERLRPGALLSLCSEEEKAVAAKGSEEELEIVRRAFQRRLVSTPGVVATRAGRLEIPLEIKALDPGTGCPKIEACFAALRTKGEIPNGEVCPDGISEWRHAKELGLGVHYQWSVKPPDEWLEARKAWGTWCRLVLKHNRSGLDSEKQVKDAVDVGKLNDGGLLAEWRAVSPTYTPVTEAVWHSDEALEAAAAFLSNTGGIVWTEHVHVGEKLSALTGLPYFAQKGCDKSGRFIVDHGGRPCIASIASNGTGRNLQCHSQALALTFPQSPLMAEQLTARLHRPGQGKPVSWQVWLGSAESVLGWELAVIGAKYQRDSLGSDARLLYATTDGMPSASEIARRPGHRWRK